MTVTKHQQLEWLANSFSEWPGLYGQNVRIFAFDGVIEITREEWQQERDKMQKQDNSWHERGELPPVGCECEAFADGCEPEPCTILAIHNGAAAVKWSKFNNGGLDVITLNGWSFRPLRTEREKAIDEMVYEFINHYGDPKGGERYLPIAAKLYDAGYRNEQAK